MIVDHGSYNVTTYINKKEKEKKKEKKRKRKNISILPLFIVFFLTLLESKLEGHLKYHRRNP